MTLFIIASVFILVLAIVGYQLVINKYYWGPKGEPKDEDEQKR
jgi:hypothetical protein